MGASADNKMTVSQSERYADIRDALEAARVYRIPVELTVRDAVIRGYVTASDTGEIEIADAFGAGRRFSAYVNQDSISRIETLDGRATMFQMEWL